MDSDVWSKKFLACAKLKNYTKLLLCRKDKETFDKVPTASKYKDMVAGNSEDNKKVAKLSEKDSMTQCLHFNPSY